MEFNFSTGVYFAMMVNGKPSPCPCLSLSLICSAGGGKMLELLGRHLAAS